MTCPDCAKEVGGNFCRYCGYDMHRGKPRCFACETLQTDDALYCYYCGVKLPEKGAEGTLRGAHYRNPMSDTKEPPKA